MTRLTPGRLAMLRRAETLLEEEKDEIFAHLDAVQADLSAMMMRVYELEDDLTEAGANNDILARQLSTMRCSRDEALRKLEGPGDAPAV